MKFKFLLIMLACFPSLQYATNCFVIAKDSSISVKKIPINRQISNSSNINPFAERSCIAGISVDAEIRRTAPNYLIRIILKDIKGMEYLIMESYKEIRNEEIFILTDYCEETAILDNVVPDTIKVIVLNAVLNLSGINISYLSEFDKNSNKQNAVNRNTKRSVLRKGQLESIVEKINQYNAQQGKLWVAGITELSLMDYKTKKRVLGMSDDSFTGGIEYYAGGIFEVGELTTNRSSNYSSPFVSEFDWRNRHGKNWTTTVKDQGNSGFCAAFTACSSIESSLNLFLNNIVNIDLSEQEAACCNGTTGVYTNGMTISAPLSYCKNHGICDDAAYPFVDDSLESTICRSDEVNPCDIVQINQYISVSSSTDSILKRALIKYGPLASGFKTSPYPGYHGISHAMSLIGFKEVHLGDTINFVRYTSGQSQYTGLDIDYVVGQRERDSLIIGKTIWIFKNSYINSPYWYMVFDKQSDIHTSYAIIPQLSWVRKDSNNEFINMIDIVYEDSDGDGYYFWGLGTKPLSCPSWVSDEPDGDDHNYQYGPMDVFGNLYDLSLEAANVLVINDNVVYNTRKYIYNNIRIINGGSLTLSNLTSLYGDCVIRIEEGGQLIIDGGTLENASLQFESGSSFTVKNNGVIKMRSNCNFDSVQGCIMNVECGEIQ